MAWDFDVIAWMDDDSIRHEGKPSDINETYGCLVHSFDDETGEHEYHWFFVPGAFDDWEDWYDYIEAMMDMYGMQLA